MHQGPPAWFLAEILLASPVVQAGDATLQIQLCSEHLRAYLTGIYRDEANLRPEPGFFYLSLEMIGAWCRTLATGEDSRVSYEAYNRVRNRVFSFESHTGEDFNEYVWFYPSDQDLMAFSVGIKPSIPALTTLLQWAQQHLDVLSESFRQQAATDVDNCLALLETARRERG